VGLAMSSPITVQPWPEELYGTGKDSLVIAEGRDPAVCRRCLLLRSISTTTMIKRGTSRKAHYA